MHNLLIFDFLNSNETTASFTFLPKIQIRPTQIFYKNQFQPLKTNFQLFMENSFLFQGIYRDLICLGKLNFQLLAFTFKDI